MFSRADVERIARLARLELTNDEKDLYARQLADILEYAAQTNATVLGKPSSAYFAAALAALDAEPPGAVMVGDDIENDVGGAQAHGLRGVLVRTGKFRPGAVESSGIRPDATLSSIAALPDWLQEQAV